MYGPHLGELAFRSWEKQNISQGSWGVTLTNVLCLSHPGLYSRFSDSSINTRTTEWKSLQFSSACLNQEDARKSTSKRHKCLCHTFHVKPALQANISNFKLYSILYY